MICRKASASKARMMTMVPAVRSMVKIVAISPVTCDAGTHNNELSPIPSSIASSKCIEECTMLKWVSIAPFGLPVVPEV